MTVVAVERKKYAIIYSLLLLDIESKTDASLLTSPVKYLPVTDLFHFLTNLVSPVGNQEHHTFGRFTLQKKEV